VINGKIKKNYVLSS